MHAIPQVLPRRATEQPWLWSIVLSATSCVLVVAFTGRREAWDAPIYFTLVWPALTIWAGCAGWLDPRRAWRVAPALAAGLFLSLLVTHPGAGSLWPVGLVFALLLHVPALLLSLAAARWKQSHSP